MQAWVKPFLMKERIEISVENGIDHKEAKELAEEDLHNESAIYYDLKGYLQTSFYFGGIGGDQEVFTDIFGSVLADLPEEVFKKICGMKNLFFTFSPYPGAEVKIFNLEFPLPTNEIIVVTFPYSTIFDSRMVVRGTIAHEIGHVYLEQRRGGTKAEEEVDQILKEWGFEAEWNANLKAQEEQRLKVFDIKIHEDTGKTVCLSCAEDKDKVSINSSIS